MGIQNREPRWKRAWQCFTKWNLCLLYNAVISLLGIYPREMETYVPIKIYTWICIADWVVIAKTWKQPRYPSAGERLNKLGYMHTTECSSAMEETDYWFIQLDGPPGNVAEWKSQSQNITYYMIATIWCSRKGKIMRTVKRSVTAKASEGERDE